MLLVLTLHQDKAFVPLVGRGHIRLAWLLHAYPVRLVLGLQPLRRVAITAMLEPILGLLELPAPRPVRHAT